MILDLSELTQVKSIKTGFQVSNYSILAIVYTCLGE